jgi:XTP/dITP diphosphohydrolase
LPYLDQAKVGKENPSMTLNDPESALRDITLGSHNPHKLLELRQALDAYTPRSPALARVTISLPPEGVPDIDETGDTFVANALLKAAAFAAATQTPALADDSGLCVDALGGAPGVYSARFSGVAGPGAAAANNALLLQRLAGLPATARRAHFRCALALALPLSTHKALSDALAACCAAQGISWNAPSDAHGGCAVFEGASHGVILEAARGDGGFGYDPLFLSDDLGLTFAEATPAQKHGVSHRGRAVAALCAWLAQAVR